MEGSPKLVRGVKGGWHLCFIYFILFAAHATQRPLGGLQSLEFQVEKIKQLKYSILQVAIHVVVLKPKGRRGKGGRGFFF